MSDAQNKGNLKTRSSAKADKGGLYHVVPTGY